jgi:DNA-binding transcriptional ArsR family regulator
MGGAAWWWSTLVAPRGRSSGSWPAAGTVSVVEGGGPVSAPLYQVKAEFFKALAHPARIRVLELLSMREHAVAEMLPEVGLEPAHLSQQLAVLRKMNLVVTRREGSTVYYSLVSPQVAELLVVARRILTEVLANQVELLDDLRAAIEAAAS